MTPNTAINKDLKLNLYIVTDNRSLINLQFLIVDMADVKEDVKKKL